MPVRYIVSMTWSSDKLVAFSFVHGHAAGVDGLYGSHRVALDAGDLDQAADRVARHAQVVLHGDLGGVLHLVVGAGERGDKTACSH